MYSFCQPLSIFKPPPSYFNMSLVNDQIEPDAHLGANAIADASTGSADLPPTAAAQELSRRRG